MRSVALLRFSAAAAATTLVGAVVLQLANLHVTIPETELRLAWTLARILIQF